MNYAGKFVSSGLDSLSNAHVDLDTISHRSGPADSFTVPDAHLLFSGNFHKSGSDLVISDELHRVVVPNYFHGDKRPMLVSPDGAPLDASVVDALTGHTAYAQAGGAPAAKLVGHIAKLTGSASVVRNGVTVELQNGDAVYQSDVVQTGSGSTLGLVLNDGTTFNLSANARLMLNDLTFDATSTSNSSLITLVQGAASFVAGQVARTGDMKVATPIATMGIRGTAVILDISAADGTVSISVIDQQDNQVHAVQVYNTRGDLIGTVTSNGTTLTLTPTTTFDLIARESNKTPAQIAQEFATFQAVLNTYDIQKAIDPNLPQHTENAPNNANPQTRFASIGSSTSPNSPQTEFHSAIPSTTNTSTTGNGQTFVVQTGISNSDPGGGTPNHVPTDPGAPLQQGQGNSQTPEPPPSTPFVVNPPTVTRISSGEGDHFGPVMSADGQFITYDPDGVIYLFDRTTGATTVISPAGGTYGSPTISSDGHSIVYQSTDGVIFLYNNDPSSPLYHSTTQIGVGTSPAVSGDGSRIAVANAGNIIVYDQQGHVLATITPVTAGAVGALLKPAISADGHVIAFWSLDSQGGAGHLYAYDQSTGIISAIAQTAQNAGASAASLSADGRYVVYQSADAGGHSEIYLYDLQTHSVVFQTANPGGGSYNPVISPDGHFIIFASDAALTSNDHNAVADTYVVDVTDPAHPHFTLVSTGADGASGNAASNLGAAISAGGLFIAFGSAASNFSTGDGPGGDIFVVDPSSGRNAIIEETANSPQVLTTSGHFGVTGGINGVTLTVTDAAGNPTGLLQASFSADGNFVNWTFAESKSDFAALAYGDTATRQFLVKLTFSGGTTLIPITIGVHNAIPPTIPVGDAPPVVHEADFAVSEGGVVVLKPADIDVTDLDDSSFTFIVTGVAHGTFQLLGNGWSNTTTFTSADLAAGHVRFVHDGSEAAPTFSIQASDGEVLSNVKAGTVAFTNVNDPATIGGNGSGGVVEDQSVTTGGTLQVHDVDSPQVFQPVQQSALIGSYGNFTFNANTGAWTYTLAHNQANGLADGQVVHDTLTVKSADGTATKVIDVTITGSNDTPTLAPGSVTEGAIAVSDAPPAQNHISPDLAAKLQGSGLISNLPGAQGYGTLALDHGDDNSSGGIDITSVFGAQGVNFFGHQYTSLYINNNGNITFGSPSSTFTPDTIDAGTDNPIIAVFWADVDTRGAGNVYYDLDEADGIMTITWDNVGYYDERTDRLNSFQLVLISEGNGNFDIEYRYGGIQWTTGEASGGVNGLGGTPARAGYSAGDGTHYYELPQSGDQGALLSLSTTDGNTGIDGVDHFEVRNGEVGPPTLTATGTINFDDPDLNDIHTATSSYTGTGSALGTLTLVKHMDTTGTGTGGQYVWTYTADPAAVRQALDSLPGHSKVETFNVVISDGHGGTITQTVSVTLDETGNHAPVVSGPVAATTTEDSAPSVLDALANASDSDLQALTVVNLPTQLPVGVSYDADTHSFTLDPSVAAYQHLAQGDQTTVTVDYGVSDGDLVTSASVSWTITGINDAPAFSGHDLAQTYQPGGGAVALAGAVTVSDVDSDNYAGGSLFAAITAGGYQGDTLVVIETDNICLVGDTVMFDADGAGHFVAIGTLTDGADGLSVAFNANATDAAVAALTGAIGFENSGPSPDDGTRTVTFTLHDGGGTASGGHDTASFQATVDVVPPPTQVAVTVHSPDGYDFTTFYDDLAESQGAAADGATAFVVNADRGITFAMVGSGFGYDPDTHSVTGVINEIDIYGTTDPAQATPGHLLVSSLGWNIGIQSFIEPLDQYASSDPATHAAGVAALDSIFRGISYVYTGSAGSVDGDGTVHSGADVFVASNYADVFNGFGGPLGPNDPGNDTVDYSGAAGPISVDLATGATSGTAAAGDVFSSIENLRGTSFDDTLGGDSHNNVLFGGAGADTFVFKTSAGDTGHDTIGDFTPGEDKIELDYSAFQQNDFDSWFASHATSVNGNQDMLIDLDGTDHNTILLKNVALASLHANDFILPTSSI